MLPLRVWAERSRELRRLEEGEWWCSMPGREMRRPDAAGEEFLDELPLIRLWETRRMEEGGVSCRVWKGSREGTPDAGGE